KYKSNQIRNTDEQVWQLVTHIIKGQCGGLDRLTIFQLLGSSSMDEDVVQREWPMLFHKLRYGPASQLINMLPAYSTAETQYYPFQEADYVQLQALCVGNLTLTRLIKALWIYDEAGPISPLRDFYNMTCKLCPHLPNTYPSTTGFLAHFKTIWLSKAFWDRSDLFHKAAGFTQLSHFVRSDTYEHEPTSTLMGGPYAIKWLILVVIRTEISWQKLNSREAPLFLNPILPDLGKWHANIDSDILHLATRLEECPADTDSIDILPEYKVARPHNPAKIVDDSICDGTSIVYNRPTTSGGKVGNKGKGKGKVEIVMPLWTQAAWSPSTASTSGIVPTASSLRSEDTGGDCIRESVQSRAEGSDAMQGDPIATRTVGADCDGAGATPDDDDKDDQMWIDDEPAIRSQSQRHPHVVGYCAFASYKWAEHVVARVRSPRSPAGGAARRHKVVTSLWGTTAHR
ncbi:hypothetical protein FRC10_011693, partial [Ceratobasidium sp. 414]